MSNEKQQIIVETMRKCHDDNDMVEHLMETTNRRIEWLHGEGSAWKVDKTQVSAMLYAMYEDTNFIE